MLGDIDYTLKPQRPQLFLCKPNRTIIAKLNEAYNINTKFKLGNIDELTFDLPTQVDIRSKLVTNPHLDMIQKRYLIKLIIGNSTEWFIIDEVVKGVDDEKEVINVHAFSLAYELNDKNIFAYKNDNYKASQVLTDVLSSTLWTTGYIDANFDLKYRSFDVSNITVLNFIFQIAETFGALVIFDTENRVINFYNPDNFGVNRGLTVSYKKYLKSLNQEDNDESVVTRLKVFGKDGLSIQRVNPTGTDYIEDYSYFMYPFERDSNKNVLQHSYYMSDALCNALLDYQDLINNNKGTFTNLLSQLNSLQTQLANDEENYYQIQVQLDTILDQIDVAQTTGQDASSLIVQRNNLMNQLNTAQTTINQDNTNIQNVQSQIDNLRNTLKLENNFTADEIKELNQFVIEKIWNDNNYTDEKQLYNDAIKLFEKLKISIPIIKVDIVNFLDIVEEQRNWDKLVLGDIINIRYERLNINVQAQIIEMDFNYEDGTVTITISNTKEIKTDEDKFLKTLYKLVSTSTQVDMNKYKWNDTVATVDDVTTILNNVWDTTKRAIESGVNNSVTIDGRGITIKNPTDPNKYIRMTNGVIGFTNDGGNTFKTVLDATGVYAERLIGKILLGNNLIITDNTGTFNISGNLLTVKDNNSIARVQLGEYDTTNQKYGLKIVNSTGTATILDQDGILQTWQDSIVDNLDSSHPMQMKFYLPPETISVRKCKLNISLEPFRAYEQGAASGGGGSVTTPPSSYMTTVANTQDGGLGWMDTTTSDEYVTINSDGDHNHSYTFSGHNHTVTINGTQYATGYGQVGATITTTNSGPHTHSTNMHSHAVPQHVHYFDHTHTVSIPSHSHAMIYGIYTSTSPTNVTIKLDGNIIMSGINNNQQDITIPVSANGWHTIEISSNTLGRINASLFIQAFMSA
ncbi:phage tail spike protein [Thermoanaerobacterium thermosulfurigenes]|uniref:phage tail spike protein n=1 Tax=Thermoanaerobacterium thermosulfurigenes TaxID=33950 RepID=UPI003EF620FD